MLSMMINLLKVHHGGTKYDFSILAMFQTAGKSVSRLIFILMRDNLWTFDTFSSILDHFQIRCFDMIQPCYTEMQPQTEQMGLSFNVQQIQIHVHKICVH